MVETKEARLTCHCHQPAKARPRAKKPWLRASVAGYGPGFWTVAKPKDPSPRTRPNTTPTTTLYPVGSLLLGLQRFFEHHTLLDRCWDMWRFSDVAIEMVIVFVVVFPSPTLCSSIWISCCSAVPSLRKSSETTQESHHDLAVAAFAEWSSQSLGIDLCSLTVAYRAP